MEFLLDPNLAYILVIAGVMVTLIAILTPGTGIFEVIALMALVMVGWQLYKLPFNVWAFVLILLAVVPFIFTVRNVKRNLTLGSTIAMLLVGSAFLYKPEIGLVAPHPAMISIVSLASGSLFWFLTHKVIDAMESIPTHDLKSLVGEVGETRTEVHAEGSVYLRGEMWTAVSPEPIPVGTLVEVVEREGFMLHVRPVNDEEN